MRTIDIREAKRCLSRLVDEAAAGEPFAISKRGGQLVKVVRLEAPPPESVRRIGFMKHQLSVPDDFDRIGSAEIEALFLTQRGRAKSRKRR
ncbi:MAG TPA: type II toxin-antitoxin system prevent-host-death family antitoxin [Casimicrobiaceae bacterium]|nr:type II toxin-antitoxin system prevent-host-death family antitoxin [Casimicrobiaceae bacterium]